MTRVRTFGIKRCEHVVSRVFPLHRMLQVLREKTLALVPPRTWDDPFENLLTRARVRLPTGEWASFRWLHDSYFGQCWTLHEESDALWRIYSPDRSGILVRTTVERLRLAAAKGWRPIKADKVFIGPVQYLTTDRIRRRFASPRWRDTVWYAGSAAQARTLYMKRTAFEHEREVRVVAFCTPSDKPREVPALTVRIRPNALFKQVVLDPRASKYRVEKYTELLRDAGFKGPIIQSSLYRPPALEYRVGA